MKSLKGTLSVIAFLFFITSFSAQSWKDMMHNPSVNIYEVVQEAELYFQNVDKSAKGSGWKPYQRWLFENEPKFYPSGDRSNVDPYFVSKAYSLFLQSNPTPESLFNNGWEELGPYYIEQVTGHYSLGLGRVESFYADPNDTNRIYLGSRSGGFWKTLDGGATFTGNTTDFLIASGVNTMAVSPTNPDSILINVRNANNGTTHGIYRSVDAGDTWSITGFNPVNLGWGGLGTNNAIYKIAYHPTIPDLVFIGTSEGLYRSPDDMSTWSLPVAFFNFAFIVFHPTDPDIIYAAASNNDSEIYVSTNGGLTFNVSNPIVGNTSNIKLSVSAACPKCVYVGTSNGIWKSVDEGQNFSLLSNPGLSNYGAFAVSDVDTNYMLFGNIDVNMSDDEGLTFHKTTIWSQGNANYNTTGTYVHADIRGSRCENGVFWVNTDGFLCKSWDNGLTWKIYEGQSIRENYNLGLSQSNHYRTISGSQDNGTSIKTENSWVEFYGADGMEGIIHPLNDDWMIGSLQNGGRRRTKNGGTSQQGVTPSGQSGAWIAPLFYDPNNPMTVFHIGENIYRSDEFGSNWTQLGSPGFSGTISYATIAENNSDIMVVSRWANIEKSLDGGNTFVSIKGSLPNSSITDIAFDPNDDSVIVVTYGTYQNNNAKVYITTDQGLTWQNITYNLGNMPIRSVVIDHTDVSTIYIGAEIGVYKKAMTDNSWSLYNPDLPNMTVRELEVMYGSNTLRAATWGRGLWEFSLDGRQDFPSILTTKITDLPTDFKPLSGVDQFVTSTISYDDTITSAYVEWSINNPVFGNVISMTNTVDSTWVSDLPIPNQPDGTKVYFKVFAVGTAGDTTQTYKFMYEVRPLEYCQSSGNMSFATAVTLVNFQGIFNITGKIQPYTDYTSTAAALLEFENSYNLSVNLNTDGNYTIYARAWIDWNYDGDFEDAGEEYDLGTAINTPNGPTGLSPLSIAVPPYAHGGKTTMRVSARYNSYPEPCQTGFDGEVEDYSIIINKILLTENINASICTGDSIFLEGEWQTMVGTYYDTVYVSNTTDNVYITTLSINEHSTGTDIVIACDSLTWIDGITYTASNSNAEYAITNAGGCDSVVTLNLTLNYSNTGTDFQTACDSFTWIDGITYTASNSVAEYAFANASGCDSVVTLNLTMSYGNSITDVQTACNSYTWIDGIIYTASNTVAEHIVPNASGCDSVITLDLTMNYSNTGIDTQTACETYTWIDGITYTASNSVATHTLSNSGGCDSMITLNLTISQTNNGTDVQTACDSFTWMDGITYTASNSVATHTFANAGECDSVITLNLTMSYSNVGTDVRAACDSYTWIDGITYTASNSVAEHVITNVSGCDSLVTLDLSMSYSNSGTDIQIACDSFTWMDGITYTASNSIAEHVLSNASGCDSLVTLNLTMSYSNVGTDVLTACDSYTWIDGNTYTASNSIAEHTLTNAAGCDSVVTLNLTINIIDTSVTQTGDLLTANEAGAAYQWLDCPEMTPISGAVNQSYAATANGSFAVTVTKNGCTDTSSCYTYTSVGIIENGFGNDILVYPNPTDGNFIIDLGSHYQNVSIKITGSSGKLIQSDGYTDSQLLNLKLDEPAGVYLVIIESDGKKAVIRLVKE